MATPPPPFTVRALYPYSSQHPDDLNFEEGQVIEVTSVEDDEWFDGSYSGKSGLFPRNFVELIGKPLPVAVPSRPAKKAPQPQPIDAEEQTQEKGIEEKVDKPSLHLPASKLQQDDPEDQEQDEDDDWDDPAPPVPVPVSSAPETSSASHDNKVDFTQNIRSTDDKVKDLSSSRSPPSAADSPPPKPRSAFKDRIAAFNITKEAPPLVPKSVKTSSFVHKPYVDLPTSSYVPPSFPAHNQPKDIKELPVHEADDDEEEAQKPNVLSAEPDTEDEPEAPKMSLKERIAMLQKEQDKMQAEAQAAVERKKAKSKAKKEAAANASVKSPEVRPLEPAPSGGSFKSLGRSVTGESDINGVLSANSTGHGPPIVSGAPTGIASELIVEKDEEEQQSQTAEEYEEDGDDEKETVEKDEEPEEDEEEDEEDEEDEEEAKRIALRERMARLSGGAGMNLGMIMTGGLGMPMPSSGKKKASKTKSKVVDEESDESFVVPHQTPLPMLPFADPSALTALQQKKQQNREAERKQQEEDEVEPVATAQSASVPTVPRVPSRIPPAVPVHSQSKIDEDEISSEEEDENDDYSEARRSNVNSAITSLQPPASVESEDADEEITTTQHEETSDDGYHSSSRPLSQVSEPAPHLSPNGPPILAPLDIPRGDDIIDDELGDDEKTEPEESARSPLARAPPVPLSGANRRQSYVGGSGAIPPIPHSPTSPENSQFVSIESRSMSLPQDSSPTATSAKRSSTLGIRPPPPIPGSSSSPLSTRGPSHPPHPRHPPHPPSAPLPPRHLEQISDDEDTGYEADIDTDRTVGAVATSATSRPPPPPPPGVPSPPAVRVPAYDEDDDTYEEIVQSPVYGLRRSSTLPSVPPPPPPPIQPNSPPAPRSIPPPPPEVPQTSRTAPAPASSPPAIQQQFSGNSAGRRSIDAGRGRSSLDTAGSFTTAKDISNLELEWQWYLQPDAPPPSIARAKANGDVIYEVEDSQSSKRGGRTTITRDVYVLYKDYTQTILTVRFDAHDSTNVPTVEQTHQPTPSVDQDRLEREWVKHGRKVFETASRSSTSNIPARELVAYVLSQVPGVLPSIGRRVHGITIYDNLSNATVKQSDEIRQGDVIAFKNAKFQGHKGSLHQKYNSEAGRPDYIHLGIVSEWDGTKLKVRVLEQTDNGRGKVKQESYKLGDLKSGEVRVFRVVGRDFVGWE